MQLAMDCDFVVVEPDSAEYHYIADQFYHVIAPLYGDQSDALRKISLAEDRVCELLVEKTTRQGLGILVYKIAPTNDFEIYGLPNALELKTLFVIDAKNNSGKGIGTKLLNRIFEVAQSACFQSIAVTVSESKLESRFFFERKNFKEFAAFLGKYKEGETEFLYGYILKEEPL
ncbi:MAG: GNAT family N-acetyltransferase [Parachlamydia sp.]|jgi:GNAT superfamily N-acetyltransferase|nr:GNAT family N-acetyltransferase [Parachlamydia sp.]